MVKIQWRCEQCGTLNSFGTVCRLCGYSPEKSKNGEFSPKRKRTPEPAEPLERVKNNLMWTCPQCGTGNTTADVCYRCGERRPQRQAESVAGERMPAGLFLLYPDNYPYWQQLTRKDSPTSILTPALVIYCLFISWVMINVIAVIYSLTLPLWCVLCYPAVIMLYGVLLWIGYRWSRRNMKPMPQNPPVARIYGELIYTEYLLSRSRRRTYRTSHLQIDYHFQSPRTGEVITVREVAPNTKPNQWHGAPTPGCPVAIAYWDDEHFRIL